LLPAYAYSSVAVGVGPGPAFARPWLSGSISANLFITQQVSDAFEIKKMPSCAQRH